MVPCICIYQSKAVQRAHIASEEAHKPLCKAYWVSSETESNSWPQVLGRRTPRSSLHRWLGADAVRASRPSIQQHTASQCKINRRLSNCVLVEAQHRPALFWSRRTCCPGLHGPRHTRRTLVSAAARLMSPAEAERGECEAPLLRAPDTYFVLELFLVRRACHLV